MYMEVKEIKEVRGVKCKRAVSTSNARHCTPGINLHYICITKRPRIRFHAGNRQKQSNYAKQGVQTQESDYHSVAKSQTQLCNNNKSFSAHKSGFTPKTRLICNASKPSLAHKTDSTDLERSLVCMADEPHPTENRTLLRHKMPKFRIANPGRTAGNETPYVK